MMRLRSILQLEESSIENDLYEMGEYSLSFNQSPKFNKASTEPFLEKKENSPHFDLKMKELLRNTGPLLYPGNILKDIVNV